MISADFCNVTKTIRAVFEKLHFVSYALFKGFFIFGYRIFMFVGHRPVTSKFLNTEYDWKRSIHSGLARRKYIQYNGIPETTYS